MRRLRGVRFGQFAWGANMAVIRSSSEKGGRRSERHSSYSMEPIRFHVEIECFPLPFNSGHSGGHQVLATAGPVT